MKEISEKVMIIAYGLLKFSVSPEENLKTF